MSTMTKKASARTSIKDLLNAIGSVEKRANTDDPGSIGGESTHPTAKADGNAQVAPEGSRSAENTAQVKEEVPASVDAAPEGINGSTQDDLAANIGMTAATTGNTPEVETSSAKSTKDDPGTTHPADTENSSLNGGKYSADLAKLNAMLKKAEDQAIDLVAELTVEFSSGANVKQAAAAVAPAKLAPAQAAAEKAAADKAAADKAAAEKAAAAKQTPADFQAGVDLAGVLAGVEGLSLEDKRAADELVVDQTYRIVKAASDDADAVIAYYNARVAENRKKAAQAKKRAEENESGSASGGAGESDEEESERGNSGGDGGGSEEDLLAMLEGSGAGGGGGGGEGGGGAPGGDPMMGGGDPMAGGAPGAGGPMPGGGDPMMGGGAPGGGDPMAGGGGGGAPDPEALQMLEQIMQQLGITPEQLQAASVNKMAAALKAKQAAAKPKPKSGRSPQQEAKFASIRQQVLEIMDRGRA